ncbi:hypothetical protein MTO96_000295 [Rhipicephalus appendiculatus]
MPPYFRQTVLQAFVTGAAPKYARHVCFRGLARPSADDLARSGPSRGTPPSPRTARRRAAPSPTDSPANHRLLDAGARVRAPPARTSRHPRRPRLPATRDTARPRDSPAPPPPRRPRPGSSTPWLLRLRSSSVDALSASAVRTGCNSYLVGQLLDGWSGHSHSSGPAPPARRRSGRPQGVPPCPYALEVPPSVAAGRLMAAPRWTSRVQSLRRHCEQEHGLRLRERVYLCSVCDATLPERPSGHPCLRSLSPTAPTPASQHRCTRCQQTFPSARGLVNHRRWHNDQDAASPGSPRGPPAAVVPVAAVSAAPPGRLRRTGTLSCEHPHGRFPADVTAGLYPSSSRGARPRRHCNPPRDAAPSRASSSSPTPHGAGFDDACFATGIAEFFGVNVSDRPRSRRGRGRDRRRGRGRS